MQGRQGQGNDPRNKPPQRISPLNGTGRQKESVGGKEPDLLTGKLRAISSTSEHRAIPKRPAGMRRLDTPPSTPRVARPAHHSDSPGRTRRRLMFWGGVLLVLSIVSAFVGYGAYNLLNGLSFSSGPATVATDFLGNLQKADYDQAYHSLGPSITIKTSLEDFKLQAQAQDDNYGKVIEYKQVADTTTQPNDTTMIFTYEIKRSKDKTYQLHITLKRAQDGSWKISDYGGSLGPKAG
jgi:hypothetical protein